MFRFPMHLGVEVGPKLPTYQSCPSSTMERMPSAYERVCAAMVKKRKGASKAKVPVLRDLPREGVRETSVPSGRKRPREKGLGDPSRNAFDRTYFDRDPAKYQMLVADDASRPPLVLDLMSSRVPDSISDVETVTALPQAWNLDLNDIAQRQDSLRAAQALAFQAATMLTQAVAVHDAQVGEIRSLKARLLKEEEDRQMLEEKVSTLIKERDDAIWKAGLLAATIDKLRRELKVEMPKAHAEEVKKTKELAKAKEKLKQSEAVSDDPSKDPKLFSVLINYFAITDAIRVGKRAKIDTAVLEKSLKDYAACNPLHEAFYLHILDLETEHGVDLSWYPDRSKLLMPGQAVPELDDDGE